MRSLLSAIVRPYLTKNPTAVAALDLIRKHDGGPVCYDHFAFRTFGVCSFLFDSSWGALFQRFPFFYYRFIDKFSRDFDFENTCTARSAALFHLLSCLHWDGSIKLGIEVYHALSGWWMWNRCYVSSVPWSWVQSPWWAAISSQKVACALVFTTWPSAGHGW